MEDGAFRCDANISVRAVNGSFWGPKVEIKNMNSFRSVVRALKFEEVRQRRVVAAGGTLVQETRGWSEATGETISQRTKEQAHDYRYFPEPDLPPLELAESTLHAIKASLGELPAARRDRYISEFALSLTDASVLTSDDSIARYFETVCGDAPDSRSAKVAANWVLNDILGLQKARSLAVDVFPVDANVLRELIGMVEAGTITGRAAKELLPRIESGETANLAAERLSLLSLNDSDAVRDAARASIAAFGRLIGETIKLTGGRAKPDEVRAILIEELSV
jgi:aspartyl-tRNA(Asn)/glutamyl-tRNA(Gln) amidotransferase subunit B